MMEHLKVEKKQEKQIEYFYKKYDFKCYNKKKIRK